MLEIIQKAIQSNREPALERHYYSQQELRNIPVNLLREHGCYPAMPGRVDIEFFAECIANFHYVDLPEGCQGVTRYGYHERPTIYISNAIASPDTPEQEGRLRFVIAHECGHVIMQNRLYERACDRYKRVPSWYAVSVAPEYSMAYCLCCKSQKDYSRYRWYEWQANAAAANLLMPPEHLGYVIRSCIREVARTPAFVDERSRWEVPFIISDTLQEIFNVSRATARIAMREFLNAHPNIIGRIFEVEKNRILYA